MIFPVEVSGSPCRCVVFGYDYKTDSFAYELMTVSKGQRVEYNKPLTTIEANYIDELLRCANLLN